MKFRFLYVDPDGREVEVETLERFTSMVESGKISETTLLYDALTRDWAPARFHPVFRLATEGLADTGSEAEPARAPEEVAQVPLHPEILEVGDDDATEAFLEELERERRRDSLNPTVVDEGISLTRGDPRAALTPPDPGPGSGGNEGTETADSPVSDPTALRLDAAKVAAMTELDFPAWETVPVRGRIPPPPPAPLVTRGPGRLAALTTVLLVVGGWGIADARSTDPLALPDEELIVRESRVASNASTAPGALEIRGSSRAAFGDMTAGFERIRARLEVDAPPPSWLSGGYLADPASHPEVPEFWNRYAALVDSLRAAEEELFRAGFVTRLQEQGITGPVLSIRLARAMQNFEEDRPRRDSVYGAMDRLVGEARELDDFLRRVEGRIAYAGVRSGALSNDPATEAVPLDEPTREALSEHLDDLFLAMDSVTGLDPERRRDLTGNVLAALQGEAN